MELFLYFYLATTCSKETPSLHVHSVGSAYKITLKICLLCVKFYLTSNIAKQTYLPAQSDTTRSSSPTNTHNVSNQQENHHAGKSPQWFCTDFQHRRIEVTSCHIKHEDNMTFDDAKSCNPARSGLLEQPITHCTH